LFRCPEDLQLQAWHELCSMGSHHTIPPCLLETCPFLICPVNNSDRPSGLNPIFFEYSQHLHSHAHTKDTVEAATRGLGVQVEARKCCWLRIVESRANGKILPIL